MTTPQILYINGGRKPMQIHVINCKRNRFMGITPTMATEFINQV